MVPSRSIRCGIVLLCSGACVRAGTPEPVVLPCPGLCSEGSGYAPAAQLFATVVASRDSVIVWLDSGTVGVPSIHPGAGVGPVVIAGLSMRAFVARDDSSSQRERERSVDSTSTLWRALVRSDAIAVASQLHYGETVPVGRHRFALSLAEANPLGDAWVGFELDGDALDLRAGSGAHGTFHGGVKVFVCDPRDLLGVFDAPRARRLRDRYTAAC